MVYENATDSGGNLQAKIFTHWFKNPACTGLGELNPNHSIADEKSVCSKHLEIKVVAGKTFDRVGRCDLLSATSLMRIHNGELEMAADDGIVSFTMVWYP